MKRLHRLTPYRERDKRFRLKKYYIAKLKKAESGDLLMPLQDDIVKAYHIEISDVAIFEVVDKNTFIVQFVKKAMCSLVERCAI